MVFAEMRDFTGLLKIAGLEKRADPPRAGLNDPNPGIRWAHRNFGFVPQHPDSYLHGANTDNDYYRVTADALTHIDDEVPWPKTGYKSLFSQEKYPGSGRRA